MSNWTNDYVYDIETYANVFTMVVANKYQQKIWVFEISDRKNDEERMRKFIKMLRSQDARMIGFNNLGFDYPVIHKIMMNRGVTAPMIFTYAQEIIESMKGNSFGFGFGVPEHEHIVRQVDLYKINHYDNKAKATSLKMIEFNMRSKNIEDLPFHVGMSLTSDQIDKLIKYNRHDVMETLKFYELNKDAITLRETLSEEYNINCTNFNDTKIGKEYFVNHLESSMPNICYSFVDGKRKINQTKRDSIDLSDIAFPYLSLIRPEFRAVLEWVKGRTITETKGVFSDICEHDLGEVAKYAHMVEKSKKLKQYCAADKETAKELRKQMKDPSLSEEEIEKLRDQICGRPKKSEVMEMLKMYPMGWVDRVVLKSGKTSFMFRWKVAESLNVVVDGLEYVFGLGGIHASREGITYEADEDYVIVDLDVASYYPNLFIANKVYPEHLSETFCDIYSEVYQKRKSFAKGTPQNAVMKLALNAVYGSTNDKFSPFYDPKTTMIITINGQFTLCLLIEKVLELESVEVIQANSDGFTVKCKRSVVEELDRLVKEWEDLTQLEMEKAIYSKMAIRDVNNYIAVYENGKTKRNGAYEYKLQHIDSEGLQFHQNQSMIVVKRAAFEAIVNGVPVERTIKGCKDPFDFCLRTKVPRSSRLVSVDEEGIEYPEQNISRYYVAKNGRQLVKIMPPLQEGGEERRLSINSGQLVKTCNDIDDFEWDVDYDFYIDQANKLVEGVGGKVV